MTLLTHIILNLASTINNGKNKPQRNNTLQSARGIYELSTRNKHLPIELSDTKHSTVGLTRKSYCIEMQARR